MSRRTRHILVGAAITGVVLTVLALIALVMYPRQITTWYTRVALERAGLERQVFDHDRGHITYFRGGEGPPLIFVHGLADQAGSWHRIARQFPDHTVFVVDLPRHGESPMTDAETMSDEALRPLFELFDASFDEPVTIVGNSLGGWVSMEYALARPGRVERLVPVGSAGLEHDIDQSLLMPETRDEARRTIHMVFGDSAPPVPGFVLDRIIERSGESVIAETFDHLDDVDDIDYLDDELATLDIPVHLVWGTEDLIFPLDYAKRLDGKLPRSQLHVIDGCGHAPQVGCPDEFADLLITIIEGDDVETIPE